MKGDTRGSGPAGPSGPGRSRLEPVVAASLAAAFACIAYRDVLGLWFTGIDALPLILSARLDSWTAAPALLIREYLSAYGGDAIAGSTGVRPAGSALFALDHALWGLDPRGYHVTDVAIHGVNTALVVLLAWTLAPSRRLAVALLAALAFALHPLGTAAVPLMAARYDLLLCTFTLLTLIAVLRYGAAPSGRRLAAVLLAGALALLAKETAVVLLPIIWVAALWSWRRGAAARPLVWLALSFTALVLAFAAYRTLLLQGVGGYDVTARNPLAALVVMAQRLFLALLVPYPMGHPGAGWRFGARVLAAGVAAGFVLCALLAARDTLGAAPARRSRLAAFFGDDLDRATLLALWLCVVLAFYTLAYTLTGVFKELYLYSGLGTWCVLFGIVVVKVQERWRAVRAAGSSRLPVAAAAVVLAVLAFSWLRQSALAGSLGAWRAASVHAVRYVEALDAALDGLPQDATLFLVNLPLEIDCRDRICLGNTYVFDHYSLDSWRRLTRPRSRVRFVGVTSLLLEAEAPPPRARWTARDGRAFDGVVTDAVVTSPWLPAAAVGLRVSLAGDPARGARIEVADSSVLDGAHFLFDAWGTPALMAVGQAR